MPDTTTREHRPQPTSNPTQDYLEIALSPDSRVLQVIETQQSRTTPRRPSGAR